MIYELYGDLRSGAFCVEAALAEAGAPYAFREIVLDRNEQKSQAFLALNPSGKVPALRLPEGIVLTETSALLTIIAERHPECGLLPPSGSIAQAEALRWLAFMASEIYPMVEVDDYPERFAPSGAAAEALKGKARARIRERMLIVEAAVKGRWLLGDTFCAADIYAAMFTRWSYFRDWKEEHLPRICALAEALAVRPKIAPVWKRHFGS